MLTVVGTDPGADSVVGTDLGADSVVVSRYISLC